MMDRHKAHLHIRDGGFETHILKPGIVLEARSVDDWEYRRQLVIVQFPRGEAQEWLASDFTLMAK